MLLTAVAVCLDAVETTGAVPMGELQRLHERLLALDLLTSFIDDVQQVSAAAEPTTSRLCDCNIGCPDFTVWNAQPAQFSCPEVCAPGGS